MPFNLQISVPRHAEQDVVEYRLYRQGGATAPDVKVAEVVQPASGDPVFIFSLSEPKFSAVFVATALDQAGNESPQSPGLAVTGDSVAPAAPGSLKLVVMTWVP